MEFTCLSKGDGFHFPPCSMLNLCGFRILLDCPIDFSALTIFSPVPPAFSGRFDVESSQTEPVVRKRQRIEKQLDANDLIFEEPWYKTVKSLHLWDASFIDIVLISSPMGMLGLPFLTRSKGFAAKVYATEATSRIGQLLMEDLVSMHMEFRQFYGPKDSGCPQWMRWEELQVLPSALKEIALGKDCEELGAWMPLYSAADVKDCTRRVQTLKYAEEACYNGTLIIKPFSSGLEIGACNWTISCPQGNTACISNSIFGSSHAMEFDYDALQGNDLLVYSDFSSLKTMEDAENNTNNFGPVTGTSSNLREEDNHWQEAAATLLKNDGTSEEAEKLAFICTCSIDSVKAGGSVLIAIDRLGILLQLLEQLSIFLESSTLSVPVYIISSVAEKLLAYMNIIPEWLCKQRQEKLFSGEPLFGHVKLMKERKIQVFSAVHSPELLKNWQEPCIVFSPHWSLRLGAVVHLLRRWCSDQNSLLVLESGLDANMALLPFKPMEMKILQCSFTSGIGLQKVQPLLKTLQPKSLLFPKDLRCPIKFSESNKIYLYHENEMLCIPRMNHSTEIEIVTDLAYTFKVKSWKQESMSRLRGELFMEHGKYRLLSGSKTANSQQQRLLLHWGSPDLEKLLTELSKKGIDGSIKQVNGGAIDGAEPENPATTLLVHHPSKALIEVREACTVITAADENLASQISDAMDSVLGGI
ncbi:hypothetical protein SLEP1_g5194 [Rubroshorea leprosula]|uniref:Beta-Casp domain-containing protein n=1 Tax=Rubroshorea leprosula TaxID=152421 RepID=A0AAV5HX33_9ROSI|nr:hypothetical protein SLEP1_g5194 [Rubroshorea leprosula]